MPTYVLDTSAIMCLLFQEEGSDEVMALLEEARRGAAVAPRLLLPFMALMEAEYWLLRRLPRREVDYTLLLVEGWAARLVESSPEWRRQAARVKASSPVSVADAWIAALALLEDAELVHKDPAFDHVPGLKALRLPYR